jgi:hypothetical protein
MNQAPALWRTLLFPFIFAVILSCGAVHIWLPRTAQADTLPGETTPPAPDVYLPLVAYASAPLQPPRTYNAIPVEPPPTDRPAATHPDLNLAIRGFVATTGYLGLVTYNEDEQGPDPNAPQIDGMFAAPRLPAFRALYQVYDWNWGCDPPHGCLGAPISDYPVTLLEIETAPNEELSIPRRAPDIFAGDYKALVLYAEERRLTITYTRRDTAAVGYMLHLEDFAVNPGLIALYQNLDAAGRNELPALRNGEIIGVADRGTVKVATRDTGRFLDPRACKDWWQSYSAQCTVQVRR